MNGYSLFTCDNCNLIFVTTRSALDVDRGCPVCQKDTWGAVAVFNDSTYTKVERVFDEHALYPEAWMFYPHIIFGEGEDVAQLEQSLCNMAVNSGIELFIIEEGE